jgi:Xaa-Pro aminopeptidase
MKTMQEAMGNLTGMQQAIETGPFDAVVAASPENVRYIGDVNISTQSTIRDRLALIVWAKGRAPIFILCAVEEGYVRQESWIQDMRPYKEFVTRPTAVLADVLRELGLTTGLIGIETEYLAARYHQELLDQLPQLRTQPCEALFERVRMFKTEREIALLRHAFRGTEKALLSVYSTVQAGETEKSMANRLAAAIMHAGADAVAFNHINAGPNTGFPHKSPSDYQVQPGDIVKADCGGFFREYYSNVGRTAKLGKPTAEEQSYWQRLRDIHHRIIDMARPGNSGRQLFEAASRLHAKADIPFPYAHNGHSIGLSVHEHPLISPHEDLVYEPGMVTTVETRVRWVGKKGLHMEDLVQITDSAPVLLSDFFDNEEIFVI